MERFRPRRFGAALIAAGLVGLRGILAERPGRAPSQTRRAATAVTVLALVVFAALSALVAWQAKPTGSLRPAPAGAPSVVASQLTGPGATRLLRLTVAPSGTITYQLTGRETALPATGLNEPVPSGGPQTAGAVADLLQPDRAPESATRLRSLAVGFIVVDGHGNRSTIAGTLQQVAGLTQISGAASGAVWRVDPATTANGTAVVPSSRVWLEQDGMPVAALPSTTAHARSTTQLPSGPAGRDLVIAEGLGWRTHGTVAVNGRRISPAVSGDRLSYPMPAGGGRLVIDPGVLHQDVELGQLGLAALLVFLAVPFGNRRSRRRTS